jgi:hypothetical protein
MNSTTPKANFILVPSILWGADFRGRRRITQLRRRQRLHMRQGCEGDAKWWGEDFQALKIPHPALRATFSRWEKGRAERLSLLHQQNLACVDSGLVKLIQLHQ